MTIVSEYPDKESATSSPEFSKKAPAAVWAQEGSDVTLTAELERGVGTLTSVTWSHGEDSLSAASEDRYETSEKSNSVHLSIPRVRAEDGGLYTVVAKNHLGEARTTLHLTVQSPGMKNDAPVFLRSLSDLAVKVGTRTRFLVEVRSCSHVKVSWYRNDEIIQAGDRFTFLHEGNFYCVDVAPVVVEDEGQWTCVASNLGGRANCSASLKVLVPRAYKTPEFLEELRALLTEQGTVSLECKVVGVPTPILRWYKDGVEIRAGDVFALTASPDDPTSLGTYACEAINCMGKSVSSSRVQVVGKGSREGSLLPADKVAHGPAPVILEKVGHQRVKVGEPWKISTRISVPPQPKSVTWYNNGKEVDSLGDDKYMLDDDGNGRFSVSLNSVDLTDEGQWKCVVSNVDGDKVETLFNMDLTVPKNYRKPRFLENLRAILTEEGLVSFECKVVGFPTPQLRWFKDGQELKPGDVYQLSGTNSLGSYSCMAKNCMGEATSTAELTIEDIQNQLNEEERQQLMQATNQPPQFLTGLRSCESKINETFRFTVQVTKKPSEPQLTWYKNDEQIEVGDGKYKLIKDDGGVFHLDIGPLEIDDQGEWKCLAVNEYGHSLSCCHLKLTIPTHYKKPRFLENLRAILSEEGTVNLECKVIGVPQPTLKWYKDGAELKPGDIHRIISGEDGTCCLGTYTCEARNCMGTVSSSAALLGFEERMMGKDGREPRRPPAEAARLARDPSLSTIQEERSSQMVSLYETPQSEQSGYMDEKAEVSVSIDGREVSVSLYETPDITEEYAKKIVEMYADELSEHISEHNVIELPPMRFIKETSTSGNIVMEAVVVEVTSDKFMTARSGEQRTDEERTEADIEELSITDEAFESPMTPSLATTSAEMEKEMVNYLDKMMARNVPLKTQQPLKVEEADVRSNFQVFSDTDIPVVAQAKEEDVSLLHPIMVEDMAALADELESMSAELRSWHESMAIEREASLREAAMMEELDIRTADLDEMSEKSDLKRLASLREESEWKTAVVQQHEMLSGEPEEISESALKRMKTEGKAAESMVSARGVAAIEEMQLQAAQGVMSDRSSVGTEATATLGEGTMQVCQVQELVQMEGAQSMSTMEGASAQEASLKSAQYMEAGMMEEKQALEEAQAMDNTLSAAEASVEISALGVGHVQEAVQLEGDARNLSTLDNITSLQASMTIETPQEMIAAQECTDLNDTLKGLTTADSVSMSDASFRVTTPDEAVGIHEQLPYDDAPRDMSTPDAAMAKASMQLETPQGMAVAQEANLVESVQPVKSPDMASLTDASLKVVETQAAVQQQGQAFEQTGALSSQDASSSKASVQVESLKEVAQVHELQVQGQAVASSAQVQSAQATVGLESSQQAGLVQQVQVHDDVKSMTSTEDASAEASLHMASMKQVAMVQQQVEMQDGAQSMSSTMDAISTDASLQMASAREVAVVQEQVQAEGSLRTMTPQLSSAEASIEMASAQQVALNQEQALLMEGTRPLSSLEESVSTSATVQSAQQVAVAQGETVLEEAQSLSLSSMAQSTEATMKISTKEVAVAQQAQTEGTVQTLQVTDGKALQQQAAVSAQLAEMQAAINDQQDQLSVAETLSDVDSLSKLEDTAVAGAEASQLKKAAVAQQGVMMQQAESLKSAKVTQATAEGQKALIQEMSVEGQETSAQEAKVSTGAEKQDAQVSTGAEKQEAKVSTGAEKQEAKVSTGSEKQEAKVSTGPEAQEAKTATVASSQEAHLEEAGKLKAEQLQQATTAEVSEQKASAHIQEADVKRDAKPEDKQDKSDELEAKKKEVKSGMEDMAAMVQEMAESFRELGKEVLSEEMKESKEEDSDRAKEKLAQDEGKEVKDSEKKVEEKRRKSSDKGAKQDESDLVKSIQDLAKSLKESSQEVMEMLSTEDKGIEEVLSQEKETAENVLVKEAKEKKNLEKKAEDEKKAKAQDGDKNKVMDENKSLEEAQKGEKKAKGSLKGEKEKMEEGINKLEEAKQKAREEMEKLAEEKKKLADEMEKARAEIRRIEEERALELGKGKKKMTPEEKKKLEEEKEKLTELKDKLEAEKKKSEEQKKLVEDQLKATRELKKEMDEEKKRVDEAKMKAEAGMKEAAEDKERAEEEMRKRKEEMNDARAEIEQVEEKRKKAEADKEEKSRRQKDEEGAKQEVKDEESKDVKRKDSKKKKAEEEAKKKEAEEMKQREEVEAKKMKEEEEKKKKEVEVKKEAEEKKQKEEAEAKKKEEEKKRKEEAEVKKREVEEKKQKEEAEAKKKEEEEKKKEEAEVKKQKEEAEAKKKEADEKKQKEEAEAKKKDEEKKKKEESEVKKKEAEEKKQKEEAEAKKEEEEKKKKADAEAKKKEAEEKKQKEEADSKKKEAEEKKQKEEVEAKKKEAEEKKKTEEAEAKKKEEEEKKMKEEAEAKKKEAEEMKQKEEVEVKKKEAEEKKKKEEAEIKKKEGEEKKQKEEAEAKKKEEADIKKKEGEEKKQKEEAEAKKKEEEEKKKKEEAEAKKKEAEEKKQKEEAEAKKKEEEEKKIKEEAELKQKADEEKKKQEEVEAKQKEAEEKKKQEEAEPKGAKKRDSKKGKKAEEEAKKKEAEEKKQKEEAEAKKKVEAEAEAKKKEEAEAVKKQEEEKSKSEEEAKKEAEKTKKRGSKKGKKSEDEGLKEQKAKEEEEKKRVQKEEEEKAKAKQAEEQRLKEEEEKKRSEEMKQKEKPEVAKRGSKKGRKASDKELIIAEEERKQNESDEKKQKEEERNRVKEEEKLRERKREDDHKAVRKDSEDTTRSDKDTDKYQKQETKYAKDSTHMERNEGYLRPGPRTDPDEDMARRRTAIGAMQSAGSHLGLDRPSYEPKRIGQSSYSPSRYDMSPSRYSEHHLQRRPPPSTRTVTSDEGYTSHAAERRSRRDSLPLEYERTRDRSYDRISPSPLRAGRRTGSGLYLGRSSEELLLEEYNLRSKIQSMTSLHALETSDMSRFRPRRALGMGIYRSRSKKPEDSSLESLPDLADKRRPFASSSLGSLHQYPSYTQLSRSTTSIPQRRVKIRENFAEDTLVGLDELSSDIGSPRPMMDRSSLLQRVHTLSEVEDLPLDMSRQGLGQFSKSPSVDRMYGSGDIPRVPEVYPGRDPAKRPRFSMKLQDRIVNKDSRIKMTCSVLGIPDPEVKWYKNGIPLFSDGFKVLLTSDSGVAAMEIFGASRIDTAEYTCVAQNYHGRCSSSAIVRVFGDDIPRPTPTSFPSGMRHHYRSDTEELMMECVVLGSPEKITWLKDGSRLLGRGRFKSSMTADGRCRLAVTDPKPYDSGTYTCQAQNDLWTDEVSTYVRYDGRGKDFQIPKPVLKHKEPEGTPRFESHLCDRFVKLGDDALFQVEVTGSPRPTITWLRNGRQVAPSSRIQIREHPGGLHTLSITDLQALDLGVYTCRASNSISTTDTTASLSFLYAGEAGSHEKPPSFLQKPVSVLTVVVGEDIVFGCKVEGEPKPKVSWLRNTQDITTSSRGIKEVVNDTYRFTLKRAIPSDSGTYTIEVRNVYGTAKSFVTIKVQGRARSVTPEGDWQSDKLSKGGSLRDLTSFSGRRATRTLPGPIPVEPIVVDSGPSWVSLRWAKPEHHGISPVIAYRVEAWILGEGARWQELGFAAIPSFDAFGLQCGREYLFRVTPRNRYGWGESVTTSHPVALGTRVQLPEFVSILPGTIKALRGSSVTLDCQVHGDPHPEVRWLRNGANMDPGRKPRYSVSYDGQRCSLNIDQVMAEDEAKFSCEASNTAGRVATFARLQVVDDAKLLEADRKIRRGIVSIIERGDMEQLPPQFTMRLRDRRVQLTYPVRLTCQVVGHPTPEVNWYKDGALIHEDDRHSLTHEENFYTLELSTTRLEDSGIYSCVAKNIHAAVSCKSQLVVDKGIRAYISPGFIRELEDKTVVQGATLHLEAAIEAYPSVGVIWHRDGIKLRPNRRQTMILDHDGHVSLVISGVSPQDCGIYTCTATNEVGQAECTAKVTVSTTSTTRRTEDTPSPNLKRDASAPTFLKKPRSSDAVEGDTVIILCEVVGEPKPDVVWLRDFLKPDYYKDADRFVQVGEGSEYRLEIPCVKLDYTGAYSVIARNCHGEAKAVISLQIYAKGQGKQNVMDHPTVKHSVVQTVPEVMQPLRDLRCCDGDWVSFECKIKSTPPPNVRWERGGKILKLGGDFASEFDESTGTARLVIKEVYPEDEGQYTCVAYNELGRIDTSACLLVDVSDEKETSVSCLLDKPVGLVSAGSTPRSTPRSTPSKSPAPQRRSRPPEEPAPRWHVPTKVAPPKFYSVPHNKVVQEGDTARFQVAIAGHPDPKAIWDKDYTVVRDGGRFRVIEKDELRVLEIMDVRPQDAGLYRVTLENVVGRVEASARLDVIGKSGPGLSTGIRAWSSSPVATIPYSMTRRMSGSSNLRESVSDYRTGRVRAHTDHPDNQRQMDGEPPVFVEGLKDTEVNEGEPAELTVKLTGTQPVAVVWVKGDQVIPNCADFTYTRKENGVYSLRIPDAFCQDADVYFCEAYNAFGEAETYARLTVIESEPWVQAPEFREKAATVKVTEGRPAVFRVRVEGHPIPKVVWRLNDKEVQDGPCTEIEVEDKDAKGQVHTLTLRDTKLRDAGEITCRAANIHGEVVCFAQLLVRQGEASQSPSRHARVNNMSGCLESLDVMDETPCIVEGPRDVTALTGQSVVLTATFAGTCTGVRWIKGGKDISKDERIRIHTDDQSSRLELTDITADDNGKYGIVVENEAGSDTAYSSLAVEGRPEPPALPPNVTCRSSGQVTLTWYGAAYDGGRAVTGYHVQTLRDDWMSWTHVSPEGTCLMATSHVVRDLDPGHAYSFRILAENVHGLSAPSQASEPMVPNPDMDSCSAEEETEEEGSFPEVKVQDTASFQERFELQEEVGKGRFGVVYRALCRSSEEVVAAKVVRYVTAKDKERVRSEVEVMNGLICHPRLVRLVAAFERHRDFVLVTEYISGGELFERVAADDFVLTERDCILFMRQICEGVEFMHWRSVVHLDLKPENILCIAKNSHQIKLIDFGLAKKLHPDEQVRVMFGTPEFIAPEVISYEPISLSSDMWSVGVVCYVLLSGLSPFMGDNDVETFANVTRADFDYDDEAFDDISHDAKDFINKLLVKRKEKRMSASQCLQHSWLSQKEQTMKAVKLSTDKLKKFVIRRKWQKTGNAIRALARMANLTSRRSSGGSNSSRASLTRMSRVCEEDPPLDCVTSDPPTLTNVIANGCPGEKHGLSEDDSSDSGMDGEDRTDHANVKRPPLIRQRRVEGDTCFPKST